MHPVKPFVIPLAVAAITVTLSAQATKIGLATVAPQSSEWHFALLEWRQKVETSTKRQVTVRIDEGGLRGSENAVIERMRIPKSPVNAALLTAVGLSHIDDAFSVFGLPFFFESDEEMRHVRDQLTPMLADTLEARGFHLLCWGEGGWVQLFSKRPVRSLTDLKRVKLYTSEGNDRMVQWYKANGFTPIAMPETEIVKQLSAINGVEAVPMPPYPAQVQGLYQWTKHMLDIRVAPLLGGIVVTNDVWNSLSETDRRSVSTAAAAFERRIEAAIPALDRGSIEEMQKPGRDLSVTRLDAAAAEAFHAEAEKLLATAGESLVPRTIFQAALRERAAFRAARR